MRILFVLLLANALIACAPQAEWSRQSETSSDFQIAHGYCQSQYRRNALLLGQVYSGIEFEKCMNSYGWAGKFKEQTGFPQ